MKTVYQDEKNVVLDENSVEWKPFINRESKSLEITIKLYSCHDINMKFLVFVTPPSIYQFHCPTWSGRMTYLIRQNTTTGKKRHCWKSPLLVDYTSKINLRWTTSSSATSLMHPMHCILWSHTWRGKTVDLTLKRFIAGMKILPCKSSTLARPNVQLRPFSIETKR